MFIIAFDGGAPLGLSYGSGIMKIEFCTKICTLARVKKISLPTKKSNRLTQIAVNNPEFELEQILEHEIKLSKQCERKAA